MRFFPDSAGLRILLTAGLLLIASSARAGRPIVVGSPTFGVDGQPFVWDNTHTIQFRTDGGPLGSMSNSSANTLIDQSFQTWAQVPTASLSFSRAGAITGVADGDVNTMSEFDSVYASCVSGSQTPVIYDDGTLLGQLTGDSSVVGLAGPCLLSPAGKIQSAFGIMGNPSFLTSTLLSAVVVHEIGHMVGLGHTDIPSPWTGTSQADTDNLPTMAPILSTPMQSSLALDDKAWVSKLYPSASYASSYGWITGHVFFSDGLNPVKGALVVARKINDIHITAVSSFTGYRFTNNPGQSYTADYLPCTPASSCTGGTLGDNTGGSQYGSRDPALIGYFEIPVPPGQYYVEVDSPFRGYSGYFEPQDEDTLPLPGPEEPWNTNESANDGTSFTDPSPGVVTISIGVTMSDIDIILNGTDPPFDIFEHSTLNRLERRDGRSKTLYAWLDRKRLSGAEP